MRGMPTWRWGRLYKKRQGVQDGRPGRQKKRRDGWKRWAVVGMEDRSVAAVVGKGVVDESMK